MDQLRSALTTLKNWLDWLPSSVAALLIIALAGALALALHAWARKLTRRLLADRYPYALAILTKLRGVTQMAIFILAMIIAIPVAPIPYDLAVLLARLLAIAIIGLVGWSALVALHIAADVYLLRFQLDTEDNLLARKHNTQVRVLLRAVDVLLILFTVGAALMTFGAVRQYGVSLFASAGVAGIVAGLAARPVLSNLIAGVQIAITQPIRIDDAVIVEGEWGGDRGHHRDLCRGAHLGPAAADRAAVLLHREAVPELDPRELGAARHRHVLSRLPGAGRSHP
jgi:small-conductance mechanosensitive channel